MKFIVNHKNGENCHMELDKYPNVYYMKKWWLEHTFKDENGRKIQFRGWINTIALDPKDFPETLKGTFWASKVPENGLLKDGSVGMKGHFDIGFGEADNYVIGSCYPIYLEETTQVANYAHNPSRYGAEMILESLKPLKTFPYFKANIEDCLVLKNTYVDKISNDH